MKRETITFKPKQTSKALLGVLQERARDIVTKRYGLDGKDSLTLEAIGQKYGITRERVRQIENAALQTIKKSDAFKRIARELEELRNLMADFGGIVHEQQFLGHVAADVATQNHVHFLMVLGDAFTQLKEDDEFHRRWTVDSTLSTKVHESLRRVCSSLSEDDLIHESELVAHFLKELKEATGSDKVEEVARRWISISKQINKNPLGEWGLASSPNVKMRGIRDYAYLVLRAHGSPMHFTEVAGQIKKLFGKNAHPATCHNELIKDSRFVLVGRGLYALAEWGYSKGVVRDVIRAVLAGGKRLGKDEIVKQVLKERYVKENTILVNLQNPKYFKRDKDGRYLVA